nr:retrovirus-related Pol polyprotein from transposon TNT 1-94 [Tanacetum cinerariifolium]
MVYSDQPSYSSSITYTSAHFGSIIEDVLHLFVAENEPTQQLAYEDFEQVDQLEMEELDIKWQMAMLSLRINKFQKKAGRKINFNNKDPGRFDRRKTRCYNCLQLGHFARKCNVKKVDEKARYFAFKISETEEGEQVYGLMAGFKSDFADHAGNAAGSVYDAAAKFAMMGIYLKVTFGSKSNTSSINTSESNDFVSCDNSDKSSKSATYDFASCVSSPKTNDSFPTVDVKILQKSDVKDPSPTNGIPICSFKENVKPSRNLCNKSGIADRIPCKNNFVRTKTCFVCGSKSHLIKDCDVYDNVDNLPSVASKAASVPAGSRNSSASYSAGRSIPAVSRNRPASIYAGRHIPAGRFNKPAPFPAGRSVPTGWTNHATRPFFRPTNLYFDNVSWPRIYDHMSMNEGRWGSAVKSSAGIVDSGCLKSMTRNKEKLDDFVQVKGGIVTFGGVDGKITRKGTIRTSKLNFENVYYVEELQNFNLFSVSQICDKKNKTINKLAKNGLVEGLPLKLFTNEHNYVVCNKGKQHKASYKAISAVRTIFKPLKLLHMDPFGLTSIRSYTHFKSNTPAGTQDTNINAEELARLQRQEHEAHYVTKKYGFEVSNETAEMVHQAEIETRGNLVLAAGDLAGSIVYTGGVPTGSVPDGSVLARSIPAGSVPASSVPAGGVLAGSVDSAGFGDPAISEFVPAVFNLDHADNSTLPPGHSLGSSEHSTRFPSPSDLGNHQPKAGIFSSSSYDDDFCADVTQSPIQTRSKVQKSKFVPLPDGKIAIGTKWILKNKRDARGKQHKASYKAISAVRTIFEPLKLLHMDHFGPTSIRSIDQKYYSLVVTDDFSRFSWTLFLGTKDETFYILKDFIALIENQLNKKVKAIRCDNGTEFRNAKLIDLCGEKGIKRDYSNARTLQHNGIAKRKNRTLIEVARSMVSITNPHNKTPYELLSGKVPNISHLKPFGCQVIILNTSDHLGKFKGKANEGFLVGYAANSKAYRVYNLSSKKVEETLNLRYLEDKPNVQGLGQEWYFDLNYLTDSLGYTHFKSNTPTGPKVNTVSATIENHLDYAEELARLQRQEHEAHYVTEKYGFEVSNETAEMVDQAEIETRGNLVLAAGDLAGSIVYTGGVPTGSVPAGSVLAHSILAGSVAASSVPAGGVLAGSVDSAGFGDPAISEFVPAVF